MPIIHQCGFSYQVALPGEFRPAYLVAFADMGVRHAVSSSVFLLPVQNGKGIPEIAAMLQERGLVILHIRRVTSPGTHERAQRSRSAPRRRRQWHRRFLQDPSSAQGWGHRGREGRHLLVAAADGEAGGLGHLAPCSDQVAQGL